jgi:hypothetical protein
MGGASPATVTFRGITVDPGTADALTELARIVGSDIYLKPIPGFGSYRTNAASGGTDTGGGHADINAEGLTDEQARRIETRARQVGFVAWFRPRTSPYSGRSYGWQRHVHLIRRDCTDLSTAARAQVKAYDAGWDGLATPHKDTGSRAFVGATWASYKAAQKAAAPSKPTPAPAPAPTPVEDDMPTPRDLWQFDGIPAPDPTPTNPAWQPDSYLRQIYLMARATRAEVGSLRAVVAELAKGQPMTAEQITDAAKAGAAAALDEKIADADVSLNVQP